jgi:hypothetical protein
MHKIMIENPAGRTTLHFLQIIYANALLLSPVQNKDYFWHLSLDYKK